MLKKFTGYSLVLLGFLAFGFFGLYTGSAIPYPYFWMFLSMIAEITGIYLVYKSRAGKSSEQDEYNNARIDRLKQHGEKIILTTENCEIRENNYYEEVDISNNSRMNQVDALYDPNRNYRQRFIEQSAIIYHYKVAGNNYRMTSQSFACNANTLSGYIEREMIALYVDRHNKQDYIFDFTR